MVPFHALGRACAADTHIPAPLSSLTPIDPRTLTITRAFEFCVNRHQKGVLLSKTRIERTKRLNALKVRKFLGVPHSWNKQLCSSRIGAESQRARCQNTAYQQPSHWLIEKFSRPPNPLGMQWRAFHGRVPCVGRYFVCVRIQSQAHGESVRRGYRYPGAPLKFGTNRPPYSHHHTCL